MPAKELTKNTPGTRRVTLVTPDKFYTFQFNIESGNQCVVGRSDEKTAFYPIVDLTNLGAYRMGVSRMHAVLELENDVLYVTDHSSNGTEVNSVRMQKGQKLAVENHSVISFGELNLHVVIQPAISPEQQEH